MPLPARTWSSVLGAALALFAAGGWAKGTERWGDPPFAATPAGSQTTIRSDPGAHSTVIGFLTAGTRIRVTGCLPSCDDANAWALLDEGAVRMAELLPATSESEPMSEWPQPRWGKVRGGGAVVHVAPDEESDVIGHIPAGHSLAFRRDATAESKGWLRHDEGFVPVGRISLLPSNGFTGQTSPSGPVVFLWKAAKLTPEDGGDPLLLPKFTRLPLLGLEGPRVFVPGGSVPKAAVRIAAPIARPPEVPEGAKWVHVDLAEQVLTAYEGDTWVFATLISTGKPDSPTDPGLFQVWLKERTGRMVGKEPGKEYDVEGVPFIQYFHKSEALHGAFWHSSFGQRVTHGCVNLSLTDAQWLFAWAPPDLPGSWTTRMPPHYSESLWVEVDGLTPTPVARKDSYDSTVGNAAR